MNASSLELSIFIPCFNEAANIRETLDVTREVMRNRQQSYEVLVVDDGSQDGTAEVVRAYGREHPEFPMILYQNDKNCGLGRNYFLTARRAKGKYYMLVYGDNSILASVLASILDHRGKADMIIPYIANQQEREWHRRFISENFNRLVSLISGHRLRYYNGPVLHLRENVLRFEPKGSGFAYQAEILCQALQAGLSFIEVPHYYFKSRSNRSSAFRVSNVISVLRSLGRIWLPSIKNERQARSE